MTQEEVLTGGNVNHVVRKEKTVLRPTGYWSPCVHELLIHLEKQGFEGAPGFLGIDDSDREHEVICHNDAAPYNVVFQEGAPVALIDFDMAGPGPRMWDIAYSLYTTVPLASFAPDPSTGKTVEYRSDLHAEERRRRIHLFFESYGLPVPNELRQWIIGRLTTMCDTLRKGAAEGNLAFQTMVDEGHLAHYESEIRFVTDHCEEWI